jgi:hypothetical protein
MKKGSEFTMNHDYLRKGSSTLFSALNVLPDWVIGKFRQRHRYQVFSSLPKAVQKQTPEDRDLHAIVDNHATHQHQKVKNRLMRNKRVTLPCTSYQRAHRG